MMPDRAGDGKADATAVVNLIDGIREHITEQLARITAENGTRFQLLQEEIDRRFASTARELDLRLEATIRLREQLATDVARRFDSVASELDLKLDAFSRIQETAALAVDERIEATRRETVTRDLLEQEMDRRLNTVSHDRDVGDAALRDIVSSLSNKLDERYETQTKALDKAFEASAEAVRVALVNAEKAVSKAEIASEKRFDSVNEFREQQRDIIAGFMSRVEFTVAHQGLVDKMDAVDRRLGEQVSALGSRLDRGEGSDQGQAGQRTAQRLTVTQLTAAIAVLVAIASAILYATKH